MLINACRSVNVPVVLMYHKVAATHLSCIKLFEAEDEVEETGRLDFFRSSLYFRFYDVLVNSVLPFLHMGLILLY